ncbi:hypothetical protein [Phenylobacterium kunshanense]|uniref:DUF2680 domain-containing protein n=1 Tax=Phenylobacterium kunshanense TaxID=1445034 RepID=A0A328BLP5_9CAUL|nr:hypothetical protein [Phenylobacterium kunshanense]RAK67605.1 hypothetical protein DJ019_06770 [Phenylobacterium kunshanense]
MKTLILPLAAATALAAGAASAQPYHGGWTPIERRLERLDHRIDQGVRSGQLTPAEAERLHRQFERVVRIEARYARNGLSNWERRDLDRRFDQLAQQIRWERRDGDRRYGWNDYPRY